HCENAGSSGDLERRIAIRWWRLAKKSGMRAAWCPGCKRPVCRLESRLKPARHAAPPSDSKGRLRPLPQDRPVVYGRGTELSDYEPQRKRGKEEAMIATRGDTRSHFEELRSLLTGPLILPEDAAYDPMRRLWNGRIDKHPAALARCANAQDVVHT